MVEIHFEDIFYGILIFVVVMYLIFSVRGCQETQAIQDTEKFKAMNPLEKCITTCPTDFITDKKCVENCFEYVINKERERLHY